MSINLPPFNETNNTSIHLVQEIIEFIESNLFEVITPDRIAKKFYLNISHLNILFKLTCGITIMEYVRNRRLFLSGKELMTSKIPVIELALKYGYETPEAFTKAFTRFHGFPPSFVRRTYPELTAFYPIKINFEIFGGWSDLLTKQISPEQEESSISCYDNTIKHKGELSMENQKQQYQLHVKDMEYKEEWRILLSLAKHLKEANITFKVDGKTSIFAHGLEFPLDKIGLTFKWKEEEKIADFFGYEGTALSTFKGYKYFDTTFETMKVRCMFYGDENSDNTDEELYQNTHPIDIDGQIIAVQSLEFYYQNANPDSKYYKMVETWMKQGKK